MCVGLRGRMWSRLEHAHLFIHWKSVKMHELTDSWTALPSAPLGVKQRLQKGIVVDTAVEKIQKRKCIASPSAPQGVKQRSKRSFKRAKLWTQQLTIAAAHVFLLPRREQHE